MPKKHAKRQKLTGFSRLSELKAPRGVQIQQFAGETGSHEASSTPNGGKIPAVFAVLLVFPAHSWLLRFVCTPVHPTTPKTHPGGASPNSCRGIPVVPQMELLVAWVVAMKEIIGDCVGS